MASRVKGITVEINGDVTGLDKALASVNKSIKVTQNELKDVEKLLKLDPKNVELLSQKQEKLTTAIKATKEKLDALRAAQEQAKAQFESGELGKDKYDALQREIIATEEKLRDLAKTSAETNTTLTKMKDIGTTMKGVGDSITSVGKSMTTSVTAPLVAIGAAAVKATADFDSEMSKVKAISGATGDEFQQLRDKAREMGSKTKYSASEAAAAFEYMAMAGWKTNDMLSGIEGIMDLAAASGEDLAATSDIVTDALTAFGLKAQDSGHFADILAAASSNANTNVGLMGTTFKYVAPLAGSLGYSAEDVAIAIGLMANAGIKGDQAGTSLRKTLTQLTGEVKISGNALGTTTIQTVNADGSMRNLYDVLIDCREAFSKLSESEKAQAAETLVGKTALSGFLAMMNATEEDLGKLTNAVDTCDGSSKEMATTMQDNLNGQLTILGSALQELAIQIGDALMPTIRKIVSVVQGWVEKLQGLDEGTKTTIVTIGALIAAIGPVLMIIGTLTSAIGSGITAFAKLGTGIAALCTQMSLGVSGTGVLSTALSALTGPVGIVLAAVAALTAGIVTLWTTNEDFRNAIKLIWSQIVAAFSQFTETISEYLSGLSLDFSGVVDSLKTIWQGLCDFLAPVLEGVLTIVSTLISTTFDAIRGLLEVFAGLFTGDWSLMWEGISTIVETVWTGITTIIGTVLTTISGLVSAAWTDLTEITSSIFEGLRSAIATVWSSISTVISFTLTTITGLVSAAWTGLVSLTTQIFGGLKSHISDAWSDLSTITSSAMTTISDRVSKGWSSVSTLTRTGLTEISGLITKLWETIVSSSSSNFEKLKTLVSSAWTAIASTTSSLLGSLGGTITTQWTTISTSVGTTMQGMSSVISSTWNTVKGSVSTVVTSIVNVMTQQFRVGYQTISSIFTSIRTHITNAINGAKSAVSTAINAMKNAFNFSWSLPKIKLPHVSISGSFSLNPPSVPHFSISWYRKAMENGMILNSPTIFGMQGSHLLAGGEAGSEAVVGTESLMSMIRDAVASMAGGTTINYGGVTLNVYGSEGQDIRELADEIEYRINSNILRRQAAYGK